MIFLPFPHKKVRILWKILRFSTST